MTHYIVDTHVLIWIDENNPALSDKVRGLILSRDNEVYISHVSIWEMQIKIAIGRLKLSLPLQQLINEQLKNGFRLIPIHLEHIYRVATLPHIHNDPFDRLLIAQALDQDITLITSDSLIQQYDVKTVW